MSSIQRFQDDPFWAWAITSPDVDGELQKAMTLYRQRFRQEPKLVFCHQDVKPQPVAGLCIESRDFVPAGVFYFATHGRACC